MPLQEERGMEMFNRGIPYSDISSQYSGSFYPTSGRVYVYDNPGFTQFYGDDAEYLEEKNARLEYLRDKNLRSEAERRAKNYRGMALCVGFAVVLCLGCMAVATYFAGINLNEEKNGYVAWDQ